MLTERHTDHEVADQVARYLQGLKDWLVGDYHWHNQPTATTNTPGAEKPRQPSPDPPDSAPPPPN